MEIKNWLIEWFKKEGISEEKISQNLSNNYLEMGWIDSLKFIDFINDIEIKFKINFNNDEFQNRDFSNINGLSKIIRGKLNE